MKNLSFLEGNEDSQRTALLGLALAVLPTAAYYFISRRQRRRTMKRNWSFTSVGMVLGVFPEEVQAPETIINTALYFDQCPSVEDIAESIVRPMLEYERFSTVPDPDTFSSRHSNRTVQPTDLVRELVISGDLNIVNQTIFEHLEDTFLAERDDLPWWEILVVRNLGKGPSACVIRVHHGLGDGLSLVSVFEKLITNQDGEPVRSIVSSGKLRAAGQKKKKNILALVWSLLEATFHVLTLGASKFDDDTAFSKCNHPKMVYNGKRDIVLFPTVPFEFVKDMKKAANVSVNDILMTVVSQAIHDYCVSQNDPVLESKKSKTQCRALLPAGFPRTEEEIEDKTIAISNKWCMVSCEMGVGFDDILDRLHFIHEKTQEMKDKPRAYMQLGIQNNVAKHLPRSIARQTAYDTFCRHSLVLTNVPGPDQPCIFAGKLVKSVQLFFKNLITQVDLMSYAGRVYGNVIFDPDELPGLERFGQYYARALVTLGERLQVKPPAEVVTAARE